MSGPSFRNDKWFLSNFYPVDFAYQGVVCRSVEHAYQALKTTDAALRVRIRAAKTPGQAKRIAGSLLPLPRNERLTLMRNLLRIKFHIPMLKRWLLETGSEVLEEQNPWGDTFWGICNGKGENWLGRLLCEIRAEIAVEESGKDLPTCCAEFSKWEGLGFSTSSMNYCPWCGKKVS
jgi:ribA/ribD-fused uncharacterized protein